MMLRSVCLFWGPVLAVALSAASCGSSSDSTFSFPSQSWSCGGGQNCQNVYDVTVPANSTISISVSNVTGNSEIRMGLYAGSVSGTNLLNNSADERMCEGQNVGDSVSNIALASAGTYQVAIGRDTFYSTGNAGTYDLTIAVVGAGATNGGLTSANILTPTFTSCP